VNRIKNGITTSAIVGVNNQGGTVMNLKLEAIIIPVSDVDRAKKFYQESLGFRVDVDHRAPVYEEALSLPAPRRSELSHRAAHAAGIGMLDPDRHGTYTGHAGVSAGDIPDYV
jgi:catechol 2,3-dioxygenase-like lactoylglutathione lyase family enzyme